MKRNFPTKATTPRKENGKGKGKVLDEKKQMNITLKKREVNGTVNESEVTSSSRSSDHTTSI